MQTFRAMPCVVLVKKVEILLLVFWVNFSFIINNVSLIFFKPYKKILHFLREIIRCKKIAPSVHLQDLLMVPMF
jgi:hypothetical protein